MSAAYDPLQINIEDFLFHLGESVATPPVQDFEDWDDEEAVAEMLGGFFNSCGSRRSNPILYGRSILRRHARPLRPA